MLKKTYSAESPFMVNELLVSSIFSIENRTKINFKISKTIQGMKYLVFVHLKWLLFKSLFKASFWGQNGKNL